LQWNGPTRSPCHTFANTINTAGRRHPRGGGSAPRDPPREPVHPKEQKLLREKDDNLTGEDVREGLACPADRITTSSWLTAVRGADQDHTLGNTEAKSFVQKAVNDHLRDWFDRNPGEAKNHQSPQAAQAARPGSPPGRARDLTRRKSLLESVPLPGEAGRLARSGDPERRKIYVVEGDSPAARPSRGRNTGIPGILPRPRQDLNVEKSRIDLGVKQQPRSRR